MFVVETEQYDKPTLPPDMDFGQAGRLRCLLTSRRLYLIQNAGKDRSFKYGAVVFCDTNFVRYCRRLFEGGSLGSIESSFRQAVEQALPLAEYMDAFPFMIENLDNPDDAYVRSCLRGFSAFKITKPEAFRSHGHFDITGCEFDFEEAVDEQLAMMRGPDFKLIHQWMKQHYHWARVVLIKAALLTFAHPSWNVEKRLYALLEYLHTDLARIPNFELYVAHLYLDAQLRTRFFDPIQSNAKDLDGVLTNMAWDLAHWRSLFEVLLLRSRDPSWASFPVPYLLSFDRRYVELVETFRVEGLLYSEAPLRSEPIYTRAVREPISEFLHGRCHDFFTEEAFRERQQRQRLDEHQLDQRLVTAEMTLTAELTDLTARK